VTLLYAPVMTAADLRGKEFPIQPNSTKMGIWIGDPDIIVATEFGIDQSKD